MEGYLYFLYGCEFEMEMKRLSMWKDSTEINSRRGLVWLLTFCATSTKSVITLYCEVQWTWSFLHWNVDFKAAPSSTHRARELSRVKSYALFFKQVRTGPKWRSEVNLLDPYSKRVILGFQACPNNYPNGILLDPCSKEVIWFSKIVRTVIRTKSSWILGLSWWFLVRLFLVIYFFSIFSCTILFMYIPKDNQSITFR
jgi:hypothetical protein